MEKIELSDQPELRLKQLRDLDEKQQELLWNIVTENVPISPWPYGMPASAAPHVVLLGVSPGNGLDGEDTLRKKWDNKPTIGILDKGFLFPDKRNYWSKASDLCVSLVQRDAPHLDRLDALALSAHLNLGTGQNGVAGDAAIEPDIVKWVSILLHSKFNAKILVCFGLWGIMSKSHNNELWNSSGGLPVDWKSPDDAVSFGNLSFRLWKTKRQDGSPMAVVMWPNHPSRVPFAGGPESAMWQKAKQKVDKLLKKHKF